MNRPTIALACILKNEVHNLPRLLNSVKGCFDEIHLTDTGSDDGSVGLIEKWIAKGHDFGGTLFLHHFNWVDDFSAARNASFAPVKTDYIMWMDLDDVMSDAHKFCQWRDDVMHLADFWLATYHYSLNAAGKSQCAFARERVIKNDLGLTWKYFVHEGILPESKVRPVGVQYAQTWSVKHLRSDDDLKADRNRNLKIFERHNSTDHRMVYYWGKELFENGKHLEAFAKLVTAVAAEELQPHDRIMGIQYAAMSAMHLNQFEKAIQLSHQGLQLSPQRAEFFVIIGDSYLKLGKLLEATSFYHAASACQYSGDKAVQGAIFSHEDSYTHYPLNQLARIWANIGDIEKGEKFATQALERGENLESMGILKDITGIKERIGLVPTKPERTKRDEIIITCPPQGLYEWDEQVYREKGIGGSETAAVEMARWMADLSGCKVIVFAPRKERVVFGGDGGGLVEYRPAVEAVDYFRDNSPIAHIAWRNTTKFSDDPLYVWCHDLMAQGMDAGKYDKIFALSEFHKKFLRSMYGVPEEKIIVTSNGIDPKRFDACYEKVPGKVIFSSSPDRGLDKALLVMDQVVKHQPEAKLHVYYGFDNMLKMNMVAQVDALKAMMAERPYVVFHGNLPQAKLTEEFGSACVWLYPTNFLETYCITAVEAICSRVYPVVRNWGALPDTLNEAVKNGIASVVDVSPDTEGGILVYADEVVRALKIKAWENGTVAPSNYSWEKVAREWLQIFGIGDKCQRTNSM